MFVTLMPRKIFSLSGKGEGAWASFTIYPLWDGDVGGGGRGGGGDWQGRIYIVLSWAGGIRWCTTPTIKPLNGISIISAALTPFMGIVPALYTENAH